LEEPASDKQNKNAKERTKKQLDKHLLVENEYGTGRASYGAKGCVDQFEAAEGVKTQRASDPLFKFLQDGKHGIAAGWDDDVQH
jgi:hypothetical protein